MPTTPEIPTTSPIGRSTPRVDGPLKVSGKAQYASDFHFPGQLYAVPVEATIASGRGASLDTAAAEKMPGVRAIFHRANIGSIFRSVQGQGFEGIIDERRPPFEDDERHGDAAVVGQRNVERIDPLRGEVARHGARDGQLGRA